ncbi:MAG: PKD domain-containing protein [Candidatus Acidiferrales bacterium]
MPLAFGSLLLFSQLALSDTPSLQNRQLSVTVRSGDGSYQIGLVGTSHPVIRAVVAAEIDHLWIRSTDYPQHQISQSPFNDVLGRGEQVVVSSTGLADRPDLIYTLRLYDSLPFGDIQVVVRNPTGRSVTVQSIRVVEALGQRPVDLGEQDAADRVLSDSFSEDWPDLRIYDLGQSPRAMHLAVGSQLIYNRESKLSLFWGALTSDRFLTIMHLQASAPPQGSTRITSYTIDSTGTTEIQSTDSESGLLKAPAHDRIQLSLPVASGGSLSSERVMFAAGSDYLAQLNDYGAAVRELHHSRTFGANLLGWWSWTAFYQKITAGDALTNAQWLAEHLQPLGYDYFHMDEGYEYTRGEYMTPDAVKFPEGVRRLTQEIRGLGLVPGIWTAPFEVTDRSWVYLNHKDWLVHDASGEPISVGTVEQGTTDRLFVLDATHPGAQAYLRKTYRTLAVEWGIRYIKLDFMDTTAIEGNYYRPNTTALEAQRIGLEIIRRAVGDGVLLDKDGSPMLNVVGLVDEGRVSADTGHVFERSKIAAPGIFARYYMHRNFFINDPDAFTVSRQIVGEWPNPTALTLDDAQVSIALSAVSGGMYEIGDDLPTLGKDADRLALVENTDLLQMAKLGRAAVPLDLLSYRAEDEQPSVMLLREDRRQSMLAVFNWTDQSRSHRFSLSELNLPNGDSYQLSDVFNGNRSIALDGENISLENQAARSVRLIKIIDTSIPASLPSVSIVGPPNAIAGEAVQFATRADDNTVPVIDSHWDFGDGIVVAGATSSHTYTRPGTYTVRLKAEGVDGMAAAKSLSIVVSAGKTGETTQRYIEPTD